MLKIYAHRGLRMEYPENTVTSIQKALELNLAGVEFDLCFSKDMKPIIVHPETFDLINNQIIPTRSHTNYWTALHNIEALSNIDAGSWFDKGLTHLRMPNLDQVLTLNWGSQEALVEFKLPHDFWLIQSKAIQDKTARIIDMLSSDVSHYYLLSFNLDFLHFVKKTFPKVRVIANIWANSLQEYENVLRTCSKFAPDIIDLPHTAFLKFPKLETILKEYVNASKTKSDLFCYESDSDGVSNMNPSSMRGVVEWKSLFKRFKISGFITDFPKAFVVNEN